MERQIYGTPNVESENFTPPEFFIDFILSVKILKPYILHAYSACKSTPNCAGIIRMPLGILCRKRCKKSTQASTQRTQGTQLTQATQGTQQAVPIHALHALSWMN